MRTDLGIDNYEIEYWLPIFGSKPFKRIAYADYSREYEMSEAHLFEL